MTGNSGLELNGMPAAGDVSGAATSNDDKHSKRMKHPHLPTEMALSNYTLANDMCQHNVDALNDANETHKLLASDSRDDNNQTTSNDSNRKRQKMICYDFQKGGCRRRVCRVSVRRCVHTHMRRLIGIDLGLFMLPVSTRDESGASSILS